MARLSKIEWLSVRRFAAQHRPKSLTPVFVLRISNKRYGTEPRWHMHLVTGNPINCRPVLYLRPTSRHRFGTSGNSSADDVEDMVQFALVNGQRTAPVPGLAGTCPACESPVVARCGNIRVHHWAHRAERNCDPWWERETQWHRDWKNNFPKEFQEVVLFDEQTGEKHIADVRTDKGLVVEFQHSRLHPDERASREQFYKNIVWIADGARLKGDLPRFLEGRSALRAVAQGIFIMLHPREAFPRSWLECAVPVFFDFHDGPDTDTRNGPLHCLLPGRAHGHAVIVAMGRADFIRRASSGAEVLPAQKIVSDVEQALIAAERAWLEAEQARLKVAMRNRRYNAMLALARPQYRRPARRRRF